LKIALISDAWRPQINGVVTTLTKTCQTLERLGHDVEPITPDRFRNWPCPTYPSIRLALGCGRKLQRLLDDCLPDSIHIATEGPLGLAARCYCLKHNLAFTTSFHTRFPEYVNLRFGIPVGWGYAFLRWFHRPASHVMVATASLEDELGNEGFHNLVRWSRGVDTALFHPRSDRPFADEGPIFMYVGRVAVEKNVEAFLKLTLPGTRYVVGDGPRLDQLEASYSDVRFVGFKSGEALAEYYAAADVFVFPSLTDTFGLTMLEALASGVPVAAYPVQGPRDVLLDDRVGCMSEDLKAAALKALSLDRTACREYAQHYSWEACTRQFLSQLTSARRSCMRTATGRSTSSCGQRPS